MSSKAPYQALVDGTSKDVRAILALADPLTILVGLPPRLTPVAGTGMGKPLFHFSIAGGFIEQGNYRHLRPLPARNEAWMARLPEGGVSR